MPNYTAVLSKKAQKQLDKLSDNIAEPIFEAITALEKKSTSARLQKIKG